MTPDNEQLNLNKVSTWSGEAGYVIRNFSTVLDEMGMIIFEINGNYLKFKSKDAELLFQYDVDRYSSSGRGILVDIVFVKDAISLRLSQLIHEDPHSKKLYDLLAEGARQWIAPINVFRELFVKYILPRVSA